MNFYEATIFFVVLAIVILSIALPAALISPAPNVGTPNAAQFYNEANPNPWVVHVTPTCVPVPSTDYSMIRAHSNALFAASFAGGADPRGLSNLAWGFGQLLMSDIVVLTGDSMLAPINITLGAPYPPLPPVVVNGSAVPASMNVTQLQTRCGTNFTQNPWGCCEALNDVTSILDLSWLYGSSTGDAAPLRSNIRGQMLLSAGGNLPLDGQGLFMSGDSGVNENTIIAALTTLFVLEHNRWANELYALNPGWSDDQLFYKARSYVIAEYQAIVFNEWIPAVLPNLAPIGITPPLPNSPLPASVTNSSQVTLEFAVGAAYFFRSMVNGAAVPFKNASTTVATVVSTGVPAILFNAWNSAGERYDQHVATTLINNTDTMYDYISEILVWEQQVGLAPYSGIRGAYGVAPAPSFPNGGNPTTPLSGLFGEYPLLPGSSLSLTTLSILTDQLRRSALFDPYFYTNPGMPGYLGPSFYQQLAGMRLATLIELNTGVQSHSPFFRR